jgi:hypothetical protein
MDGLWNGWRTKHGKQGNMAAYPSLVPGTHPNQVMYVWTSLAEAQWRDFMDRVEDAIGEELYENTWKASRMTGPLVGNGPPTAKLPGHIQRPTALGHNNTTRYDTYDTIRSDTIRHEQANSVSMVILFEMVQCERVHLRTSQHVRTGEGRAHPPTCTSIDNIKIFSNISLYFIHDHSEHDVRLQ